GQASFSISTLGLGTHDLSAHFEGTNNFGDSNGDSGPVQVVEQTFTALVGTPSLSTFGQLVTFMATVTPVDAGVGVPTGAITFLDGTKALATALLNGAGKATYTPAALVAGNHSITVAFAGTGGFLNSSNSTIQVVKKAATTTAVVSAVHPTV